MSECSIPWYHWYRHPRTLDDRWQIIQEYMFSEPKPSVKDLALKFNGPIKQIRYILCNQSETRLTYEEKKPNNKEKQQSEMRQSNSFEDDEYIIINLALKFQIIKEYELKFPRPTVKDLADKLKIAELHIRAILYNQSNIVKMYESKYRSPIGKGKRYKELWAIDRLKIIHDYCYSEPQPSKLALAAKYNLSYEETSALVLNYEAMPNVGKNSHVETSAYRINGRRRLNFLNLAVYEYLQRSVYHNVPLNESLVLRKANEINECISLSDEIPSHKWLMDFKKISGLEDLSLKYLKSKWAMQEVKEQSLDAVDIVRYFIDGYMNSLIRGKQYRGNKEEDNISLDNFYLKYIKNRNSSKKNFGKSCIVKRIKKKKQKGPKEKINNKINLETKESKRKLLTKENEERKKNKNVLKIKIGSTEAIENKDPLKSKSLDKTKCGTDIDPEKNQDVMTFTDEDEDEEIVTILEIEDGDLEDILKEEEQEFIDIKMEKNTFELDQKTDEFMNFENSPEKTPIEINSNMIKIKTEPLDMETEKEEDEFISLISNKNPVKLETVDHSDEMTIKMETHTDTMESDDLENSLKIKNENGDSNTENSRSQSPLCSIEHPEEALKLVQLLENYALARKNVKAIGLLAYLEDSLTKKNEK